jgi:hypothetical protein
MPYALCAMLYEDGAGGWRRQVFCGRSGGWVEQDQFLLYLQFVIQNPCLPAGRRNPQSAI